MGDKYPAEEIENLFDRYVNETNEKVIKKRPFAEFVQQLYQQKELHWLDKPIPEHYWRRSSYLGFHQIEKYNEVTNSAIIENVNPNVVLPNIKESVDKLINNPEELIKKLQPYEKELKTLLLNERKSTKRIKSLNKEILELKKQIKELKDLNNTMQDTIYKLFYYSKNRKGTAGLKNILTTTKNASKPVKNALDDIFSHKALDYIERSEDMKKNNTVVDLQGHKKEPPNNLDLWKKL